MKKSSVVCLLIFCCATILSKAQSYEHKTLISGVGNFSKLSSARTFDDINNNNGTTTFRNSDKTLNFELSAVYFITSKIAIGASASLYHGSNTYYREITSGNITNSVTDSSISREIGGALRFDFLAIEKDKFSFGFKSSGGNYLVVTKSIVLNESLNPPNSFTSKTQQSTKGNSLRFSIVPTLYYKITEHIVGQVSYASLYYRKTVSKLEPPANENSSVETTYGANLNFSSFAFGLSILF